MKSSLKAWHFATLATAAAFALALYRLGYESFWIDEFIFRKLAHLPFAEIWSDAARQFHPPLHAWLMHGWLNIAPAADEFWLRLPSAIFFALTVPVTYLIGRMLGGTPRAGVYVAFLAATFPFLFQYGQWARPYAILTFFAACGFAAVAHLAFRYRDEAAAPRLLGAGLAEAARLAACGEWRTAWRALRDDGAWMVYVVSASAVMWLHNTAAIFPLATGLIFLCAIWAIPSYRGLRFANLCIATGLIVLLYAPHILHLVGQTMDINLASYVPEPDVNRLLWIFRQIYGGKYLSLALLALFLIALIPWVRRGRWERVAFAVLGSLVAVVILTLFSFWKPILQPKLLVWSLVPFLATCAAGLASLTLSWLRVILLAVLVAWNLKGVAWELKTMKHDVRGTYQIFSKEASSDATLVISPPGYLDISRYYLEQQGRGYIPVHTLVRDQREVVRITPGGDPGERIDPMALFVKYREVWLASTTRHGLDSFTKALEQGRLTKHWKFNEGRGWFGLWRYERK